jgi:TRAP-type mannitol/chloroaromatic compound transport system permease small subunit
VPELDFVLPHWLYWSGLVLFPIVTMILFRRTKNSSAAAKKPVSLTLAYAMLLSAGFIGVHRLYLKSRWAAVFVLLFLSVLVVNVEVRIARDGMSSADNKVMMAEFKIQRAEKNVLKGKRNAEEKLEEAQKDLQEAQTEQVSAAEFQSLWNNISTGLGLTILFLMLVDAILLPGLVKRKNQTESLPGETFSCPVVEQEYQDNKEPIAINRWISHFNGLVGEFVAYWSLIAVVVYYYEVMARYLFNSPTNWAHESMFLMFGMQYLLAGGFVLREGAHVRVDVVYMHLSNRGKAIVDLLTSVFFFIFMVTLLITGWIFFMDSYNVSEVSFTEWGIQYWPIKIALPLGAMLLLLQGIVQLINDILVVINPDIKVLDTNTRPEG